MKKQKVKLNESQLRGAIRESIKKILNEDYSRAFELIEELKNCGLSSDDILRDLIGRIGGYAAEKYLLDIKRVEIDPYCDDDEDDLASNQLS